MIRLLFRFAAWFTCAISLFSVQCVSAAEYGLTATDDLIGAPDRVRSVYEDTLVDIARRHGLGYEEIRLANPTVDAWLPGEGTEVFLPTRFILPDAPRSGIVINIAEYRMYFFFEADGESRVRTFPISIGRMDWGTPLGRSSIVSKNTNPSWYPPQSIRDEWAADGRKLGSRVPPGPDNPLGAYAIRLSIPGYLIHGTNRPAGVGMRVTHGCIRMFPEDIEWLFPKVPVDAPVRIVNQPFKLGWYGDELFLEVHPPLEEGGAAEEAADGQIVVDATEATEPTGGSESKNEPQATDAPDNGEDPNPATDSAAEQWSLTRITELYIATTRDRSAIVDWPLVEQTWRERLGTPVRIGRAETADPVWIELAKAAGEHAGGETATPR